MLTTTLGVSEFATTSMPIFFLSTRCVLILSLVGCILIRAVKPEPRLLLFFVPLGLSQALLVAAGVFAEKLPASAIDIFSIRFDAGAVLFW